jgi:hypothetical protein
MPPAVSRQKMWPYLNRCGTSPASASIFAVTVPVEMKLRKKNLGTGS